MKDKKVFLGGTCNGSNWRENLIPKLKINYFNPVVKDWKPKHQKIEIIQRKACDYCLYVLTPKMTGVYSIAEVVDDSNKQPKKTIFCVLKNDSRNKFSDHQLKSMDAVGKMVENNGGKYFHSLDEVAKYLNK